ncbi:15-hydroxyprostaglandin dehydrogenase [NAD(+)]-like [Anthonomus grandis grandis]|uniref:15-hydroxyprostaglandin dehydrogenase [NAD(+)]-like n=1 Tax=Anthonomus grandis grandis TaxID=2921223 RepID=UPI002164F722|nr:15-hydroxyprostaglandin dehydrogenase [NAD(+)]-like [Anthonomus grandis grandis]
MSPLVKRVAGVASRLLRSRVATIKKNFSDHEEPEEEEPWNLEQKCAIVNGGASGIGLEISREFLSRGVQNLSIIDINEETGERAQEALSKEFGSGKVLFFQADVSDSKTMDDVYRKSIQFHDVPDIVVNSAGIMNDTKWDKQIWTNMSGYVVGTLLGLQYMSRSSNGYGGIIVNIGSILGIIPSSGYPLHTMTQFGVCGFSKALGSGRHIQRTGVKIFALCPGLTDTRLLSEAPSKAINERFAQEYADEIDGTTPQRPDSVAKGLVEILEQAQPGSVWVVENDESPYEVTYPGNVLDIKREGETKEGEEENATSVVSN